MYVSLVLGFLKSKVGIAENFQKGNKIKIKTSNFQILMKTFDILFLGIRRRNMN